MMGQEGKQRVLTSKPFGHWASNLCRLFQSIRMYIKFKTFWSSSNLYILIFSIDLDVPESMGTDLCWWWVNDGSRGHKRTHGNVKDGLARMGFVGRIRVCSHNPKVGVQQGVGDVARPTRFHTWATRSPLHVTQHVILVSLLWAHQNQEWTWHVTFIPYEIFAT